MIILHMYLSISVKVVVMLETIGKVSAMLVIISPPPQIYERSLKVVNQSSQAAARLVEVVG